MRPIDLVALDIDGTLVGEDSIVSLACRVALAEASRRGCRVALVTGRSRTSTLPVAEQLGDGVVAALGTYDGALIELHPSGEVLADIRLAPEAAYTAFFSMAEAGLGPEVFMGPEYPHRIVVWKDGPPSSGWLDENRQRVWVADRGEVEAALAARPITISALAAYADTQACVEHLERSLGSAASLRITYSPRYGGHFAQVAGPNAEKGNAVELIANHFGVARERVLAVGDWLNDVAMLRWAGTGVAMGASEPDVIAAADWVTTSLEEDGVAAAIRRFVLGDA
jgi:hypothetical protein